MSKNPNTAHDAPGSRAHTVATLREIADRIEREEEIHFIASFAVRHDGPRGEKLMKIFAHQWGEEIFRDALSWASFKNHLFESFKNQTTIFPKAN